MQLDLKSCASSSIVDNSSVLRLRSRIVLERFAHAAGKRLGLNMELLESADSVIELHPPEVVEGRSCIVLPDQYERVRRGAFGIDTKNEVAQLGGAKRFVGPTLQYTIKDVVVCRGNIYRRGKAIHFGAGREQSNDDKRVTEYGRIALRSSYVGCHFFGHWLRDDCATHLLAEQISAPMSMPTPTWRDQSGYLDLFGQQTTSLDHAYVEELVLYDDITQNSHKAERFRRLRARVRERRQPVRPGEIVYLMRGASGKRRELVNEPEILNALVKRGVHIVTAEELKVDDLVGQLLDARLIIGVEGSQLSHAVYTVRNDGGLLVIQPPDRFFTSHIHWAQSLNLQCGVVVGQQSDTGFNLPVADLLRTIDAMLAQL